MITLCVSCSVMSDSAIPQTCSLPGFYVHGTLQTRILEWGDSLLQGIFPTQGMNLSFLLCRQILYFLSRQGSPKRSSWSFPKEKESLLKNCSPYECTKAIFLNWLSLSNALQISINILVFPKWLSFTNRCQDFYMFSKLRFSPSIAVIKEMIPL